MADKLFTWVDIDSRLTEAAVGGEWPYWLLEADAWWDALELSVRPGTSVGEVREFLDDQFGIESAVDGEESLELLLDRPESHTPRSLPVRLTETADAPQVARRPRLNERRITSELSEPLPRPASSVYPGDRQIIAFHSFKGGVGRTLHAVALADLLASRGQHVLLIDADLEAPGITWMYQAQGGRCDIAYDDVLALLHSSTDGEPTDAVQIAAAYLPNQEVSRHAGNGRVTILPSSRRTMLGPPRIGPSDLLTEDRSPYFLSESLAALAVAAEADVIVLDLRAGASELSGPLLLDPRVTRVFVSTISSQSLRGTEAMIHRVGTHAPALVGMDPAPGAIVTQYRLDMHDGHADEAKTLLSNALSLAIVLPVDDGTAEHDEDHLAVDEQVLTEPVLSPFREELLALPDSWDAVVDVMRRCGLPRLVAEFAPSAMLVPHRPDENPEVLGRRRSALAEFTGALLKRQPFDAGPDSDFFTIEPTRRFIAAHRTDLPITVVTGEAGTGKTFTFARMCAARTWDAFAWTAGVTVRQSARIVPVLAAPDAPDTIWYADPGPVEAEGLWEESPREQRPAGPERRDRILTFIESSSRHPSAESMAFWQERWLTCLAMAAGAPDEAETMEYLLRHEALFLIDGLEEWLDQHDGAWVSVAFSSLVGLVPQSLRRLRKQSLGLVIFTRPGAPMERALKGPVNRDGRTLRRRPPFELHWTTEDALKLALWLSVRSDAVQAPEWPIADLGEEETTRCLLPLWGLRMGSDGSREAWTDRWFASALADAHERVQPRDVIRFLHAAAVTSADDGRWSDRVLIPSAMRQALADCGALKIEELQYRFPHVWDLLRTLANHAVDEQSPFFAGDVGLTHRAVRELQDWGALSKTPDGRYQLPELYRLALGIRTEGRSRTIPPR
ncbi:KGGVGR-motif variant AAA ATPase [Streptomyces sp. A 4/2]|uniref:KGGVGR-motif variant AAA ATPase n=1 Tax=Streptomyces sp. A 4/2 TaxID=2934314 RepID=UPI0020244AE9|nr:AAA family ATPase [Streptomyces sp. A 4/2]